MRKSILYLFVFSLSLQLAAQEQTQYSFKHFGASDGLASNEVTMVKQDSKGYVWIGTNNGLQRFDGTRYKTFRNQRTDPFSIPHNYILQLMLDKNDNLWLLTGDGKVGILDTKNFRYQEVKVTVKDEQVLLIERRLVEDDTGNLFLVYHNNEFLTWNEQKREFSAAYNFIPFPEGWRMTDIIQEPGTKKYWISANNGTAIYNAATKQLSYPGHNEANEPFIDKFGALAFPAHFFFDKQGRVWFDIWLGTANIFLYDLKKKEAVLSNFHLPLAGVYHEARGFLQQGDGTIWLKGLAVFARYLEEEKRFQLVSANYQSERSIDYDRVNDFFEDREMNIWIATNNNGLYRFDPASQFFRNIKHINHQTGKYGTGSALTFIETNKNELIVGNWADGLYRYDSNFTTLPLNIRGIDAIKPPSIWGMSYSPDSSTLWMSSQPGMYEVNMQTRSASFHNPAVFENRTLRQVVADRYGNLWIGVQNSGLFKWTPPGKGKKWEDGLTKVTSIPGATVFKLFVDISGIIWVGMASGAYAIDPANDRVVEHLSSKENTDKQLLWDVVVSMNHYDDSTLVIVAQGIHLYSIPKKKIIKLIKVPDAIPFFLTSAEKDQYGYLWISSTSGLIRLNLEKNIFVHFDRRDGIANDRFIDAASYTTRNGKLLFGADDEFVVFDPAKVKFNPATPSVTITDFKVMNQSLLVDSLLRRSHIKLSPDQNSITIEFSGLHYDGAYLIKYKLSDLDKDWIVADANNQAIYSYLPPGRYVFTIRTEDVEGKVAAIETTLIIRINPPFWQTWWFYCLLALLVAGLLYVIDRERMKRLRELQRMRTEIAGNLHEKVNTTLNNINLLSEMAKLKADRDIERSKEYIDQISSKSHNMIIAMDDILWSINPDNDNMEKTLLRMMEFIDALKNRHGVNIEMLLDKKVRSLNIDMKTRHEFFFIFKEALTMIVQYSGGTETLINIDLFQHKLSMKLQDETASFDTNITEIEKSIKEMNTRAALIPAELDIQYDKKGMAVILMVAAK